MTAICQCILNDAHAYFTSTVTQSLSLLTDKCTLKCLTMLFLMQGPVTECNVDVDVTCMIAMGGWFHFLVYSLCYCTHMMTLWVAALSRSLSSEVSHNYD